MLQSTFLKTLLSLTLSIPSIFASPLDDLAFGLEDSAGLLRRITPAGLEEEFDFEFERSEEFEPHLSSRQSSGVLRDFQVQQPPVVPHGEKCTITLLEYDFANSYGAPAIVDYVPPTDCGKAGSWASVILNLTVSVNGTQYDRLGLIYLDAIEIWRTSTSEPTTDGVIWTTYKDVSKFIPLFAKTGTLVFDEGNIYDSTYTGIYHTILTATFYEPTAEFPQPKLADEILPLSTLSITGGAVFSTPGLAQTNVTIPINTAAAYVEILASGNSAEEFWYSNIVDEVEDIYYGAGYLDDAGPFREVQLIIDGKLAGIAFPYPVIYSGGIILAWWEPMISYGSYDEPSYIIDITPFVPLLTDGEAHNFTLNVAGMGPDFTTDSNWYIDGAVYIQLDSSSKRTTGSITTYNAPQYVVPDYSYSASADNSTIYQTVTADRYIEIESEVKTGSGKTTKVVWKQQMSYSNKQIYADEAYYELVDQVSKGLSISTHNGAVAFSDDFNYPIYEWSNYTGDVWPGNITHSYDRVLAPPVILAGGLKTTIETTQKATGSLTYDPTLGAITGAVGATSEVFSYSDAKGNTYYRDVSVANDVITYDKQGGSLAPYGQTIERRATHQERSRGKLEIPTRHRNKRKALKANKRSTQPLNVSPAYGFANKFTGPLSRLNPASLVAEN